MKFLQPRICNSLRLPVICMALLFLACAPAVFASTISGVVTNLTTKKPAAGDTVSLIRLQQGMQVAAQATTDKSGHYSLDVTDNDPMHLVRVTHDGANYFQAAPPGRATVNVNVYDAAAKVEGVSTEADVQRIETDQNQLQVIENYFVKNDSSPPRTQFSDHSYVIYLPKDAQIVSSAALGPGSMPVQSSPMPLGPPGKYAFVFPLRPGETRFQVSYRVPYSGSLQFQPRVAAPVQNLALILPKSMRFAATPATAFQPIDEDVHVQTYLARNVAPGAKLSFRVSGSGQLPQDTTATQGGDNAQPANPEAAAQAAAENNTRPGIGLGVPIDTPDPLHKYMWWIISLVVVLLAVGGAIVMKQSSTPVAAAAAGGTYPAAIPASPAGVSIPPNGMPPPVGAGNHRAMLLQTLKDELFALETERLQGHLSPEEYDRQKGALELVLKRALDRDQPRATSAAV